MLNELIQIDRRRRRHGPSLTVPRGGRKHACTATPRVATDQRLVTAFLPAPLVMDVVRGAGGGRAADPSRKLLWRLVCQVRCTGCPRLGGRRCRLRGAAVLTGARRAVRLLCAVLRRRTEFRRESPLSKDRAWPSWLLIVCRGCSRAVVPGHRPGETAQEPRHEAPEPCASARSDRSVGEMPWPTSGQWRPWKPRAGESVCAQHGRRGAGGRRSAAPARVLEPSALRDSRPARPPRADIRGLSGTFWARPAGRLAPPQPSAARPQHGHPRRRGAVLAVLIGPSDRGTLMSDSPA